MDILSLLSLALATPTALLSCLSQVYMWQRKEYRLDRILAALTDAAPSPAHYLLLLAFGLWFIAWFFSIPFLALITSGLFFSLYFYRAIRLGIYRPHWTAKAIILTSLILTYLSLFWLHTIFSFNAWAIKSATLIVLTYPLVAFFVTPVNLLTNPLKRRTMARALAYRETLPRLSVVGLTGSWGKTTTKHILSHLIPAATASFAHRNSDYVIALDMLHRLTPSAKYYLVEMSAYRRGEIRDLAALTKPTLGVITHLGNQHLALFGSLTNLIKAKWELIDALPPHGIAVLNADDPRQVKQARSWHGRIWWYSQIKPADVYASQVVFQPRQITCQLHFPQRAYQVCVPLLSEAYLSSLLAAVCAAAALGLPPRDIIHRLPTITPYPRTMELATGLNGSTIIDDSYSANEQSVLNAVRHLQRFPAPDRRIVMVPLIELGACASAVHARLGLALRASAAQVFVYGRAWHRQLQQPTFTNPQPLLRLVTKHLSPDSVILLEGRVPDIIRTTLRSA